LTGRAPSEEVDTARRRPTLEFIASDVPHIVFVDFCAGMIGTVGSNGILLTLDSSDDVEACIAQTHGETPTACKDIDGCQAISSKQVVR
jgi:hypothetical protein